MPRHQEEEDGMGVSGLAPEPFHRGERKPFQVERLREALIAAKEKLKLYRAAHSGEYIGGVEYSELMRRINAALIN